MNEQPEALQLAEYHEHLADIPPKAAEDGFILRTARELRRLHAENERLHQINQSHEMKLSVRGYEIQIEDLRLAHAELRKVNGELLEALKDALFHVANQGDIGVDQWLACERKARAVIARAEGETA